MAGYFTAVRQERTKMFIKNEKKGTQASAGASPPPQDRPWQSAPTARAALESALQAMTLQERRAFYEQVNEGLKLGKNAIFDQEIGAAASQAIDVASEQRKKIQSWL
jgi:hypothetical protein